MIEVGLTGGMGSGKSTVSARLVALGAELIDADAIVHDLQRGGSPVVLEMAERWGSAILKPDGELDRQAVAQIVFKDAAELEALTAIIRPPTLAEITRRREALAGKQGIAVLDIPLLVESGYEELGGTIVVDIPVEVAVERLVEQRGFDEADVRARLANQASREERLEIADFVVDNSGDLQHLDAEVARCWEWLGSLS
ncbi:MAG: dephospho-CoA kinase [Acidimicrobiia bacterium]